MRDPKVATTAKLRREASSTSDGAVLSDADQEVYERLRKLRAQMAAKRGVPPYVIFSNRTLREMATARPAGLDAMGGLYGVGARKLEEFGPAFLKALDGN